MIAWAFANAEILSPSLFAALGSAAEGFLDEFTEEELDNMEWAFSRVADQSNLVKALWAANKRFEISKFKFKIPRARTCELHRARSRLYKFRRASPSARLWWNLSSQ